MFRNDKYHPFALSSLRLGKPLTLGIAVLSNLEISR